MIQRLARRLWRYKGRLLLSVLFAAIISVLFTGSVFALKPVGDVLFEQDTVGELRKFADKIAWTGLGGHLMALAPHLTTPEAKQRALLFVVAAILAMGVVKNLLRFAQEYLAGWVSERVVVDLTNDLYAHVQRFPPGYFTSRGTQQLVSRFVNDSTQVGNGLGRLFCRIVREPLKAIGALAIVLTIEWRLTLLAAALFPIAGVLIATFGRRVKRWVKAILQRRAEILGALAENFHGIRVLQAFGLEDHFEGRFRERNEALFADARRKVALDALTPPVMEVLVHLVGVAVILYTGTRVLAGEMGKGDFLVYYAAMAALFDPIRKLGGMNNRIQAAVAAASRVFEVLDTPPAIADAPGATALPPLGDAIRFEQVRFDYGGTTVLRDVDLTIRRGELVGIVGKSGAGKSTLVSLLPRFADPAGGRVTIDGRDLRDVRLADLRAQIGVVTQEHLLWNDTVAANIRLGRLSATDAEVEAAARAAQIHDWVVSLPAGYDTLVGEHGMTLSGGQRQRLSLARAILKNPRILVLDEATNALDAQIEHEVQQALDAFVAERTTLVIAHRLSTLHHADRIVVLDAGRVEAVGTHEELMVASAVYPALYRTQFAAPGERGSVLAEQADD